MDECVLCFPDWLAFSLGKPPAMAMMLFSAGKSGILARETLRAGESWLVYERRGPSFATPPNVFCTAYCDFVVRGKFCASR
jgi:hypothetical protein